MGNFDFARYWHLRHASKPEMPETMVDDVMLMARVPFWVLNMDSDVLTPEGANNPQLRAPVAPWMVIKKALTRIQMTQSELAHNLGVSRTFMTMLLRGDRPISLEHALAIQDVLNIPAHILLRLQADYQLYQHYHTIPLQ